MKMMKLRSVLFAALLLVTLPFASSQAQEYISTDMEPPDMPAYEQPPCPVEGYIWTPGYWAWGDADYYWVPGVWVPPPRVGLLWTPAWWGFVNGVYAFHAGFWGPTVGFYGGINYGYGYTGNGYWGGRWSGNNFQYNTAVTRVNTNVVHNTYINNSVTNNVNVNRTSFNGGNGIKAEPTAEQKAAAANARKMGPTSEQLARQQAASKDQNLRASVNKGNPNADAIKSFNRSEGAGQGGKQLEAADKLGNMPEHNRQGAGAGQGQGAKGLGTAAGAGKIGNKPGNVTERNLQGAGAGAGVGKTENNRADMVEHNRQGVGAGNAGAGKAGADANRMRTENQRNRENIGGNQAKMHTAKMGGAGGPPGQLHTMNQMSRNPQMSARNAQMGGGGKHQMQGGGNRPAPNGQQQQQKKKKPNER